MAKNNELPSLNGIRAICIAMVIGVHMSDPGQGFPAAWRPVALYIFNGNLGVRIFFILSGFLITYLLVREEQKNNRISLKHFYMRRALRIVPVCYAYILVVAIADRLLNLDLPLSEYLTAVTYTKEFAVHAQLFSHLWSLSVEEQFYLVWPFVMAMASRRNRTVVAFSCIAAAPFLRAIMHLAGVSAPGRSLPFTNMDSLMMGAVTGIWVAEGSPALERVLRWRPTRGRWLAALTIYVVWIAYISDTALRWKLGWFTLPFGDTVQGVAGAYLIASYVTVREGLGYRLLNLAWVRYIGVLSYSLYVWQQLFTGPASSYGGFQSRWLEFPYSLVPIFVAAWCSYNLLELPLLRLRNKFRSAETTQQLVAPDEIRVDVVTA